VAGLCLLRKYHEAFRWLSFLDLSFGIASLVHHLLAGIAGKIGGLDQEEREPYPRAEKVAIDSCNSIW